MGYSLGKKVVNVFLILFLVMFLVGAASAAHSQTTTITPESSVASVSTLFNAAVAIDGANSVDYVRIVIPTNGAGYSALTCGAAPANWSLASSDATTCVYTTSSAPITPGNHLDFSLTATTAGDTGTYTWAVRTTDSAAAIVNTSPTTAVDGDAPTAGIEYSKNAGVDYYSTIKVKDADTLLIKATFNEPMADSPVVKIAVDNDVLVATAMTKVSSTVYTYSLNVPAGNVNTATVSLSVGTDIAGNVITSAPTSGATFTIDNLPPTTPTSVHITSSNANPTLAKVGDTVTITATVDSGTTVTGTIGGKATTTNVVSDTTATLTRILDGSETEGAGLNFTLVSTDAAGNDATTVTKADILDASAVQTDFTAPSFNAENGVAAGPVKTDVIKVIITDAAGGYFGFSANATCDGSDTINQEFTSEVEFNVVGDHTDYLCVKATDAAGNIGYETVGQLNTDNTPPTVELTQAHADLIVKDADADVTITATFNENMADTPTISIDGPGECDITSQAMSGSNKVWTYAWNVPALCDGDATVTVSGTDVATNAYAGATNLVFTIDNTAPSFTDTDDVAAGPVKTDIIRVTITGASGGYFGFSTNATCDGDDTIDQPFGSTVPFDVAGDHTDYLCVKATDAAGNIGYETVGQLNTDNTPPTVELTQAHADLIVKDADADVTITATFNENMADTPTISIDGPGECDITSQAMSGSNKVWTYAWNVPALCDGDATVTVSGTDVATNAYAGATELVFTIDNTAPSFTVNDDVDAGPVQTDTINVTITGAASGFYGFSENATCDGDDTINQAFTSGVSFDIAGNHTDYLCVKATDAAGNIGYETVGQLNTDNTAPVFSSVALGADGYVNSAEAAAGVDIVVAITGVEDGRTVGCVVTDEGSAHSVGPVTGTTSGGAVTIASTALTSLTDGTITVTCGVSDVAGNLAVDGTDTAVKDVLAPTFTDTADVDAGPVKTDTITVTITGAAGGDYGFSLDDTCNGSDTIDQPFGSTVPFDIAGDHTDYLCVKATDAAGNIGYETVGQLNTDNTPPTVELTQAHADLIVKDADADVTITATFNENMADTPTISIDGPGECDITSQAMSGSNKVWTYAWNVPALCDGDATVTVSGTDVATNAYAGATNLVFTIDNTAPSFTDTDDVDAGPVQTDTINVTITGAASGFYGFSENATCDGDDTINQAFTSGVSFDIAGNHTDYLCVKATDAAGNIGYETVGQLNTDNTAPTISILTDDEALNKGDTAVITFTLSAASVNFSQEDVDVVGGSLSDWTAVSGTSYTVVFTPTDDSTTGATVDVQAGKFTDAAGNSNTAATQETMTVDTVAPSVEITDDETGTANIAGGSVTFTFTFSEPVTGFATGDVVVSGGSKGTFTAVSSTVYTLVVTPNEMEGNLTVDVAAGVAVDAASNGNTIAVQRVQAVDTVRPTVAITDDEDGTANIAGGSVTFTFTFSEPVTGFATGDVVVSGGSKGTFTAVSSTVYTLVVTPNEMEGNLTVDVAAGVAVDAVSNSNTIAVTDVQAVDTVRPTVALTYSDNPANAGQMTITATYSEAMSGTPKISVDQWGTTDITEASMTGGPIVWTYIYTVNAALSPTYIDGSATVSLSTVTDVVGNNSNSPTNTTFIIDTSGPANYITNPNAGSTVSSPFQLSIDTDGTASGCQYKDSTFTYGTGTDMNVSGTSFYSLITTTNGSKTYYVICIDAASNTIERSRSFIVADADTNAPSLSGVSVTPAQTTASVAFISSEAGSAKVEYGLTLTHGNATSYSSMIAGANTIVLSGLNCGTTYHYSVYGKDATNNEQSTADANFTTSACTTYEFEFPKAGTGFRVSRFGDLISRYELSNMSIWSSSLVMSEFLNANAGPAGERIAAADVNNVYIYDSTDGWTTVADESFATYNLYSEAQFLNYFVFEINADAIGKSIRHIEPAD